MQEKSIYDVVESLKVYLGKQDSDEIWALRYIKFVSWIFKFDSG